jgi:hypothetical protein
VSEARQSKRRADSLATSSPVVSALWSIERSCAATVDADGRWSAVLTDSSSLVKRVAVVAAGDMATEAEMTEAVEMSGSTAVAAGLGEGVEVPVTTR